MAWLGTPARGYLSSEALGERLLPVWPGRAGASSSSSLCAALAPDHLCPVALWGLCVVCACLWVTFPTTPGELSLWP